MADITIIRGDDKTFNVTFKESDGTPIDITGYTVFFTVKKRVDDIVDDSSALISKTITTHTDPTQGITTIILTDEDTNIDPFNYFYDLQLKDTSGAISTPKEFPAIFKVTGDITRRIS